MFPLDAIDRDALLTAGGKATNLGELLRAGLPVPPGFCVTTAAYTLMAENAGLEPTLTRLATTRPDDTARLAELAATARDHLLSTPVPTAVTDAIASAYRALGGNTSTPVAVRSSATAEDLPYASFAGQQDTYLNIVGINALVDAVRRCWASLWTDRAVSYRASNQIDHSSVRLAVAVQEMVEATVAGILFTANPLTGKRRQAVIDASPGLGEAIVSGTVNPDHFVVDTDTGKVIERRLGDKRIAVRAVAGGGTRRVEHAGYEDEACLSGKQIRSLAALGAQVEAHYGTPQDTEWAIDAAGKIWLLQARPITTLFPLPPGTPTTDDELRVYFSVNVAQGVYRPLTPMGLQAFRLAGSTMATLFGQAPRDRYAGPGAITEAAGRLFLDITPVLRSMLGRKLLDVATRNAEARTTPLLEHLAADPRLALVATPWQPVLRAVLSLTVRGRVLLYALQALLYPDAARARIACLEAEVNTLGTVPQGAGARERLAAAERLLVDGLPRILPGVAPVFAVGLSGYALTGRLLRGLATDDERQAVLRGLPHNPTTEMDLALWSLAQSIRADPDAGRTLLETPPEQLVWEYRSRTLPPTLQVGLETFLRAYGHRGVAEIDLGLPRWSEDPSYVLGVLANYLQLKDATFAPDVQFRRAAQEARTMVSELGRRAVRKGRLRGMLVRFCLGRTRELAGVREMPKYYLVLVLARIRALLWPVGEELAQAGRLEKDEDIFFITLPEAQAGTDLRSLVSKRRAAYEQELKRRYVPRILLSDGTEPTAEAHPAASGSALQGTPASAGTVTAKARVVLDPTGAQLKPGEILVAPSTDPGWTPLFLTAGGLVMEMGGPISHGAVVAREYGIPAVVGVPGATERITTGDRITVDGSAGTVLFEKECNA